MANLGVWKEEVRKEVVREELGKKRQKMGSKIWTISNGKCGVRRIKESVQQ